MSAFENLHNRIDLINIPFSDRGSRLLVFRKDDSLYIRLAERWTQWEKEYGHYRQRPPIIDRFVLFDSTDSPMRVETDTYPDKVCLSTAAGKFHWVFLDAETLFMQMPPGRYSLRFMAQAEQAQTDRRGGTLRGKRNIAYTTSARLVENTITATGNNQYEIRLTVEAVEDAGFVLNITPRLAYNRSIPSAGAALAAAHARWAAWFDATPAVLERYQQQYDYAWWIMRAGLLNTRYYFTREAMTPSKIHYVGVWHWDQFFHAIAYRHVDTRLAEDQLRIVLDHQRPDGMLPDAIYDEGLITHLTAPVDEDVTKPPLVAWTVLKIYEKSGHLDFLGEVYEPLCRWHNWWMTYSRSESGLCEYRHPFSSGLDDSPLWDEGMPVVSPDLNTYLYLQLESLARIADLIDLPDEAADHRAAADQFARLIIEQLWSEADGWFNALHQGEPVPVFTLFHLLPLWMGCLPEALSARLIEHLTDPAAFWTEHPLPTVARSDNKFDPMQMWRGPVWVNINYLFIEALKRVGRPDLAGELRRKTLDLIMLHPDIYEYYNPVTGERPPKAAPIFGWTSAVFIDLAIQETQAALESEG